MNLLRNMGFVNCQNGTLVASRFILEVTHLCLSLHSLKVISQTPIIASVENLLHCIAKAMGTGECKLQHGEKGFLSKIANHPSIKFKLREKVCESWHKAFLTIQIVLAKDEDIKTNFTFVKESVNIMNQARRLARALVIFLRIQGATVTLKNAIELEGAINGQVWHEGINVFQQIDGIGPAFALALYRSGIETISALKGTDPGHIELVLRRSSPFGNNLKETMKKIPQLGLNVRPTEKKHEILIEASGLIGLKERSLIHLIIMTKDSNHRVIMHETFERSFNIRRYIHESEANMITVSLMSSFNGKNTT